MITSMNHSEGNHSHYLHPSISTLGLHLLLDLLQVTRGQLNVLRSNVASVDKVSGIANHRTIDLQMVMGMTSSRVSRLVMTVRLEGAAGEPLQQ